MRGRTKNHSDVLYVPAEGRSQGVGRGGGGRKKKLNTLRGLVLFDRDGKLRRVSGWVQGGTLGPRNERLQHVTETAHRVSQFRNVQPELPLQRGPAGAGRSKTSIRVNYIDLRQM